MYTPICKPQQLKLGTGHTVVVTGWTPKDAVAKKLDPQKYAAIGQLYSPTRGISFLIRNLIFNPHVRYMVILNATKVDENAGGCDCLIDFFFKGFSEGISDTGKPCWVIDSKIKGYIDIEIPFEILQKLRQHIEIEAHASLKSAIAAVEAFATHTSSPWTNPTQYPISEVKNSILPGDRYGHRIEASTIAEAWVKLIHRIRTTGTIRPTGYDGKWQELINLLVVVTNEPDGFYFPEPNYLPTDPEFIKNYLPQILEDAPYEDGVKYTYGQRLRSWFHRDQIEDVIDKLIAEIDSASAVMNLWDSGRGFNNEISTAPFGREPGDSDHQHGGSPCLNHIWVRVVEGELSLTGIFRSNDMFSAWPANAMGLRSLQKHIRDEIANRSEYNLELGPLMILSQSAHIYDDCWENADKLISDQYKKNCQRQLLAFDDPCGNFIIQSQGDEILVEQTNPMGEIVATYSECVGDSVEKAVKSLSHKIASANPGLQVHHAFYLGSELQKVAIALSTKTPYLQDKSLTVA